VIGKYNPVMSGMRLKSGLGYRTMPVFTQEKIPARNTRDFGHPDQYRATMMIATTKNAAISESARSNFFDRGAAAVVSIGGMTQAP
jgi:hypothetical protein